MKDNITYKPASTGYFIKIESYSQSGILLATADMVGNPQDYSNDMLESVGTIMYGKANIGKKLAFRYTVIDAGGTVEGQRIFKNKSIILGEIVWEVNASEGQWGEVIGIKQDDGWHCEGRHIVLKRVAKPPIFTSSWLVAPETIDLPNPWEKNKFEVAWPNRFFEVGTKVGVAKDFISSIQIEGELLFYIPEEYVLFKYND